MLQKISKKNSKVNVSHCFSNFHIVFLTCYHNTDSISHMKFSQWSHYIIKQLLTIESLDRM